LLGLQLCTPSINVSMAVTDVVDLTFRRFASTDSFLQASPELRNKITQKLTIPPFLFNKMYLECNGYSGFDFRLDQKNEIQSFG
jgi:hypothetical protein